jgi:hypothetical protein
MTTIPEDDGLALSATSSERFVETLLLSLRDRLEDDPVEAFRIGKMAEDRLDEFGWTSSATRGASRSSCKRQLRSWRRAWHEQRARCGPFPWCVRSTLRLHSVCTEARQYEEALWGLDGELILQDGPEWDEMLAKHGIPQEDLPFFPDCFLILEEQRD